MKVEIKFLPQFEEAMIGGYKIMTCRTKRMGNPGDTFTSFGFEFILTHVFRIPLDYVARDCWEQEGCYSIEQFKEVWRNIHPKNGFDPCQIVWAHCFQLK
jgi:hypothetical protein